MSAQAVTHKPTKAVAKPGQQAVAESYEQSASASASAGLNLNVFGAIAGAFSGKSSKDTAEDGSSVEKKEERGVVKGAGGANMNALAAAKAESRDKHAKAAIQDSKS